MILFNVNSNILATYINQQLAIAIGQAEVPEWKSIIASAIGRYCRVQRLQQRLKQQAAYAKRKLLTFEEADADLLNSPIESLSLSVRAVNAFWKLNIHTIGGVAKYSVNQLVAMKNVGPTTVKEIEHQLALIGLCMKK
jgi:DNA-directed RNA polymerase alpha subunit